MIYVLDDTSKVSKLFEGCNDTLITSCLQKVMGKIFVTDLEAPVSAFAFVGCFGFLYGEPDRELVENKPDGFVVLVPQDERWAALIEEVFSDATRVSRYAIRKDTHFDVSLLREYLQLLPEGYELKPIDGDLYDQCMQLPEMMDFVSSFSDKEHFLRDGRGVVILKDGVIVSGASSYSRYREGIEIEVSTTKDERRKHLALVACSALILRCLEEGLYPSWDAHNMNSVRLAEKLGYVFDHEYTAYEVARTGRKH
jgi:RimJ/RimL family protein N-acetyltransferase